MKNFYKLFLVAIFLMPGMLGRSQTYQQVWSDEFNGSIGPDWVYETGGGGWGNGELEYYQSANATISNNNLVITAKRQSVGGMSYTSARMKTQGKRSWKYGKIEASIKVPSVQGLWPAFWMLGDNIGSVGWPSCGEIDIMEQINTSTTNYGTIHWNNGGHVSYGGSINASGGAYHNYSIIWTNTAITWYVDGVQYVQANIANGINNTGCFQNSFFILLNMAVGGNWPGNTIGTLPANYYVDYVRVSQLTNNPPPPPPPTGGIPYGSYITLKGNNGMFVSSENGTVAMNCNRASAQAWEKFLVVDAGGGLVALQAGSNGRYVTGSSPMYATATSIGAAQKFSWISPASGQVELKCSSNNLFVSSENGTQAMNCNRTVAQGWEIFTWATSTKSTGSDVAQLTADVALYPMPAHGSVTIQTGLTNYKVEIFDLAGKLQRKADNLNSNATLSLDGFRSGVYVVRISKDGSFTTRKLVVE